MKLLAFTDNLNFKVLIYLSTELNFILDHSLHIYRDNISNIAFNLYCSY